MLQIQSVTGEEREAAVATIAGATVEDNKYSVSVHFRNCHLDDWSKVCPLPTKTMFWSTGTIVLITQTGVEVTVSHILGIKARQIFGRHDETHPLSRFLHARSCGMPTMCVRRGLCLMEDKSCGNFVTIQHPSPLADNDFILDVNACYKTPVSYMSLSQ